MKKLFLYECNQCCKNCQIISKVEVEDVVDTISGYDSKNNCNYYYILKGEYKEK